MQTKGIHRLVKSAIMLLVFILPLTVSAQYQQTITLPNGAQGIIDWSEGQLRAVGLAVAPSNASTDAQGEVLARRGAIVDAQRMLIEMIGGLSLTGDTTMINAMANDVVRSRVEGVVQGAVVVSSDWDGRIYTVEMEIPLINIPESTIRVRPQPIEGVTGLIIDARGLNLTPALLISLLDPNGAEILAGLSALYNPALPGDTTLPDPVEQARADPRVGDNPLVIKALATSDNLVDLIIDSGNADTLRRIVVDGNPFSAVNTLIIAN